MLLARAASFFQAQGWQVKVNPCIIGDSGAIHSPDLHLVKEGEKGRVVFVLDELDGPMPLESRAHMARDMGCEAVFVVGSPSPEVRQWAERHHEDLLTDEDVPASAEPEAAGLPGPIPEDDGGAELLGAQPPAPPERPLTAFAPPAGGPAAGEVPDDGGAMLLPSTPRAEPRPRRPPEPASIPEDDGARLMPPPPPAPAEEDPEPPAAPGGGPAAAEPPRPVAPPPGGDAELLPSRAAATQDADKVLKHDPSIWDPRARLAQVRQAAKAQGFETTAPRQGPTSPWLRGLRNRA